MKEDLVAIVKTGEAKIIEGHQKFIHAINITAIENTVFQIETASTNISNPELKRLLEQKTNDLIDNVKRLKPRTRQRRWDALGRAWKWMSGSPDADDLKIMTNGIDSVSDNSNKQISINDQLYSSINNLTKTVNEIIQVETTNSKLAVEDNMILSLILNLDILNDEISAIQESITFAKIGIVNYKLLTTEEIQQIDETMSNQGVHLELLEEALNLVKVTIGASNDILLYIVNIPIFYPETYEELKIEAIYKDSQRIQLKGNDYIRGSNELFRQENPCERFGNWSMCRRSDLEDVSNDRCISKIVKGIESRCTYEHSPQHSPTVEMSQTTVLVNDISTTLHTTCGIADRNLTGSFIIVYQNCSITVGNFTYTNNIIKTTNQRIFIPSTSLIAMQENIEYKVDIHTLHQLQQQHLKHLDHLKSTTTLHGWSLVGGFSCSSMIIIFIIVYTLIKSRAQGAVQIEQTKEPQKPVETKNIHYYQPASSHSSLAAV